MISIENRNTTYQAIQPQLPGSRQKVLNAIRQLAPCTREEVSKHLGIDINQVTGRVTELRDKHVLIRETGTIKKGKYPETQIDIFRDPHERMEAIYRRKLSVRTEISHLESDLKTGRHSETRELISSRILKLKNDLKQLEKL